MPESIIISSSTSLNTNVAKPTSTFTGEVYLAMHHADNDTAIADVTFAPCARTYWHTHEHGQLIRVLAGSGWICDKGKEPRRIRAGDTIWAEPGTTHWHGADEGSIMTHFVVGHGKTEWLGEVSDEEYRSRQVE